MFKNRKSIILWVLSAFLVFIFLRFILFEIHLIRGNSMSPTLSEGTLALILKRPFFGSPKAGEIVMVSHQDEFLIKRVLAIGPASISWSSNGIFVDNHLVLQTAQTGQTRFETINLEENMVFLIGDNLKESIDSRRFGVLQDDQVLGKLVLAIRPIW